RSILETFFRGGHPGAPGDSFSRSSARQKAAKCCRLNGARIIRAIFSGASSSDVVRLLQLGFLERAELILRQADELQDLKPLEILSHSIWEVSINLTDARPPRQATKRPPRAAASTTASSTSPYRSTRSLGRQTSVTPTVGTDASGLT
ncbi:unnamed protein product, partial [Sphacelaria rigidula]